VVAWAENTSGNDLKLQKLLFYCNRRWPAAADAVLAAAVYQMNFRVNGKGFAGAGVPH